MKAEAAVLFYVQYDKILMYIITENNKSRNNYYLVVTVTFLINGLSGLTDINYI